MPFGGPNRTVFAPTEFVYDFVSAFSERTVHIPAGVYSMENASEALRAAGVPAADLGLIYRNSFEARYCEGRYGGIFYMEISDEPDMTGTRFFPERGAVFSTPVILLCGLHMAFMWRHESSLLHVIAALFCVNGVTAFGAHASGITAWHNIDSKSMLLAVWLSLGFLMSELIENSMRMCRCGGPSWRCIRRFLSAFTWVMVLTIYWWVAETNGRVFQFEIGERIGAAFTAIPLLVAVVVNFTLATCCKKRLGKQMGSDAAISRARCRFMFGFLFASLGVVSWVVTENLCGQDTFIGRFFRWFPGHFLWHICMAYGMMQGMIFAGALRADNFNCTVEVYEGRGCTRSSGRCFGDPCTLYYYLFPSLRLIPKHSDGFGIHPSERIPNYDSAEDEEAPPPKVALSIQKATPELKAHHASAQQQQQGQAAAANGAGGADMVSKFDDYTDYDDGGEDI